VKLLGKEKKHIKAGAINAWCHKCDKHSVLINPMEKVLLCGRKVWDGKCSTCGVQLWGYQSNKISR